MNRCAVITRSVCAEHALAQQRYVIYEGRSRSFCKLVLAMAIARLETVDLAFGCVWCAGFLVPLTQDLTDFAQSQLPELSDYDQGSAACRVWNAGTATYERAAKDPKLEERS